jgi:probable HAF family extracellular repeat protein
VIGVSGPEGSEHLFSWTLAGGMIDLGFRSAIGVVNDNGVVVGADMASNHAVTWNAIDGVTDLGTLGGVSGSEASGVNNHGMVVGTAYASDGQLDGFAWTPTSGMVDLGPNRRPVRVNDDGQIIGQMLSHAGAPWHAGLISASPTVRVLTPATGDVYTQGQVVTASYTCSGVFAIVSCVSSVANGSPIDTSSLGSHTFTLNTSDTAGGTATVSHTYTVIPDTQPPSVAVTAPSEGGIYAQGQAVTADYACTDEGSGIATCAGPVADADLIDTAASGPHDFTVTSVDHAGNSTVATASYTVIAPIVVSDVLPSGGGVLTTDSGNTGPTSDQPLQTTLASPTEGSAVISQGATTATAPSGYTFGNLQVDIAAPAASPTTPLELTFSLDDTLLAAMGTTADELVVFRDGVPIAGCADTAQVIADPDPCVFHRADANGVTTLSVYSSHASTWNFGAALAPTGPAVSIGDTSILEGDSGTRVLKFPVTLWQPATTTVSVQYQITGDDATGAAEFTTGLDFNDRGGKLGTLTFKPSSKTGLTPVEKFVSVKVYSDTDTETNQSLHVTLLNPSNGLALAGAQGTGTIINDDGLVGGTTLGVGDGTIVRSSTGKTVLAIPVTLSVGTGAVSATYTVALGAGTSYNKKPNSGGDIGGHLTGTVSISAGKTSRVLGIPIWPGAFFSGERTFTITLTNLNATGVTDVRPTATGHIFSP